MALKKISDVAKASKLNATDKVPLGQGGTAAVTATIQQISDFVGAEQHIADKATTIDLSKVKRGDTIQEYPSHCVFNYANAPVHFETCTHDGTLYYLICAYHGFNNKGQVYYAFSGKQCTNVWNYGDVPQWVKDCFLEFFTERLDEIEEMKDDMEKIPGINKNTQYLLHLFGEYATPAPQSLVIDPTRKDVAISSESMSEVEAQGWAISQPIVIRKGNIYRIKVGEASGQYVTTAMRYQYRDEQGNLRYAYKRKTQLDEHSELPIDGYLIMYGLPRDYELVVCFKYTADYDPVVEVLTAGLLRTLAFQLGDMQDMIDQKLDVNGHSSAASVGGAMALLQKGDVPEDTYSELLTARMIGNAPDLMHVHGSTDTRTGIDDGKDVNVVVEKVWGDCIGGNQMASKADNEKEFTNVDSGIKPKCTIGHVVMFPIFVKTVNGENDISCECYVYGNNGINYNNWHLTGIDGEYKCKCGIVKLNNDMQNWKGVQYRQSNGVTLSKKGFTLLDLTTLFLTDPDFVDSLTENDAIKVAHRLGFAAFTLD